MELTAAAIKDLALPNGAKDKTFWDDALPGFGLRVREGGSANWVVQYDTGGKTKRVTLGSPALMSSTKARAAAKDLLASIRLGRDPGKEKREAAARAAETFGAYLPRHLAVQERETRPRTYKETKYRLERLAKPLHPRALADIKLRDIANLISSVSENHGAATALGLHGSLVGYFSWAIGEGMLDQNPAVGCNRPARKDRERILTELELRTLWAALRDDDDYSDVIRLLLLTGLRREEIGGLRWSEVDLDDGTLELPGGRMKNGLPFLQPLTKPALAILRRRQQARTGSDHVFGRNGFQHWSQARKALDVRLGDPRPDWVLHDFRRTASTVLHERLGVPPHIVERCLAHVGHQGGIAGVYNRAEYFDDKHVALTKWADWLLAVMAGKSTEATVVSMRRSRWSKSAA
jgi:integrase